MMNVHRFVSGPALVSGLLATALIGLTGCGGGSKGGGQSFDKHLDDEIPF